MKSLRLGAGWLLSFLLSCAPIGAANAANDSPAWLSWSRSSFELARTQNKLILLNVHAAWCHWCHVMDDTTYKNPEILALIRQHFVPIAVDVDARPDIAERYGKIGWPATAFFTPDGRTIKEIGAYIDPETFLAALKEILAEANGGNIPERDLSPLPARSRQVARGDIDAVANWAEKELLRYYDPELGGWGRRQKAPVADAVEHALFKGWAKRAYYTLLSQRPLMDPVWGGMYQYSDGGIWTRPHFEKIMTVQAGALENYAQAYHASDDARFLSLTRMMAQYFKDFLMSPEGLFYTSQDADLGKTAGADYFCLSDQERRRLGIPRVDKNIYARENGLAIGAFAKAYAATADEKLRDMALKAARGVMASHGNTSGGFSHASGGKGPFYLADNAAFGLALLHCYEISGDASFKQAAIRTGDFLLRELQAPDGLGFLAGSKDHDTPDGFETPLKPFQDNALAARFLMKLHGHTADKRFKEAAGNVLAYLSDRPLLEEQGRFLGTYLLAMEEYRNEPLHLLTLGGKADPKAEELHGACLAIYAPHKIVQWEDPKENPVILKSYPAFDHPVVYVCGVHRCSSPVSNAADLADTITDFQAK